MGTGNFGEALSEGGAPAGLELRWQMALADGVWLYMQKEQEMWRKVFPKKKMAALDNTLSGVSDMLAYNGDKLALEG